MDKTLQKQLQTTTNLLQRRSPDTPWAICCSTAVQMSEESSLTLVKVICLPSSRVVVERNPDGLLTSTSRLEVREKMQSPELMLAKAIYSTSRQQKRREPLVTRVKELSPRLANPLLHSREHRISAMSSSMSVATQELHSYQTSMVLVLSLSMSSTSKELHSAKLDLVSSSTWATWSREEHTTTVLLPMLYSLLWIMVRLLPTQSTPSRFNLSPMIRLKVVRTRELLIL